MSIALSTEGFVVPSSGGGSTGSPPVIASVSPTPNTTPGSVGGMPTNYALARETPLVVKVTDPDGAVTLTHVTVTATFLDGTGETVFEGNAIAGSFLNRYVAGSSWTGIANGLQLSIARDAGWPAAPIVATPLAVGLRVTAVDSGGNVTTATYYYQMPVTVGADLIVGVEAPVTGAVDMIAEALDKLVWQFRSA